jgi:hypothetical protein
MALRQRAFAKIVTPLLVLFLVGGLLSGCRDKKPSQSGTDRNATGTTSAPGGGTSAEVNQLKQEARSKDKLVREEAVGKLLRRVKEGMSQAEVEELLGPPSDLRIRGEKEDLVRAVYYARLADPNVARGTHLMTVEYKKEGDRLTVIRVSGPHFPD